MINVLKELVGKVGNLYEHLGNFSCDGNARNEKKKPMPIAMKKPLEGSSIDLAQLTKVSELEESQ